MRANVHMAARPGNVRLNTIPYGSSKSNRTELYKPIVWNCMRNCTEPYTSWYRTVQMFGIELYMSSYRTVWTLCVEPYTSWYRTVRTYCIELYMSWYITVQTHCIEPYVPWYRTVWTSCTELYGCIVQNCTALSCTVPYSYVQFHLYSSIQ